MSARRSRRRRSVLAGLRNRCGPSASRSPRPALRARWASLSRRTQIVLGAILLDLFAVLFGGAVALLPDSSRTTSSPWGRPDWGLARRPSSRSADRRGLPDPPARQPACCTAVAVMVAAFGAWDHRVRAVRNFALSLVALLISGFVDLFSVISAPPLRRSPTPDALPGRVGSGGRWCSISASNQLGRSSPASRHHSSEPVPAVVTGGCTDDRDRDRMGPAVPASWTGLDRMDDIGAQRGRGVDLAV